MTALLNAGRFADSGVGHAPETPHSVVCVRPETPHFCADFFDIERETGKNTHRHPQEKHTNTPPE